MTDPTVKFTGTLTVNGKNYVSTTNLGDELDLLGTLGGAGTLTVGGKGLLLLTGEIPAGVQVVVAGGTCQIWDTLSGTGGIEVQSGATLDTNGVGSPDYSGPITLDDGGTILWYDKSDAFGLGKGKLDLKGGNIPQLGHRRYRHAQRVQPADARGKRAHRHGTQPVEPRAAEPSNTITVSAASSVQLVGVNPLIIPARTNITGTGPITFNGVGSVHLFGPVSTPLVFANNNGQNNTEQLASSALNAEVTVTNKGAVVEMTAALCGSGTIDVKAGTLTTDQSLGAIGPSHYDGMVILDGSGPAAATIQYRDSQDAKGLGLGILDLEGGTLKSFVAASPQIAAIIFTNPTILEGQTAIDSGALSVSWSNIAVNAPSTLTLTGSGYFVIPTGLAGSGGASLTFAGSMPVWLSGQRIRAAHVPDPQSAVRRVELRVAAAGQAPP